MRHLIHHKAINIPIKVTLASEYLLNLEQKGYLELDYSENTNEFGAHYEKCEELTRKEIDKILNELDNL